MECSIIIAKCYWIFRSEILQHFANVIKLFYTCLLPFFVLFFSNPHYLLPGLPQWVSKWLPLPCLHSNPFLHRAVRLIFQKQLSSLLRSFFPTVPYYLRNKNPTAELLSKSSKKWFFFLLLSYLLSIQTTRSLSLDVQQNLASLYFSSCYIDIHSKMLSHCEMLQKTPNAIFSDPPN